MHRLDLGLYSHPKEFWGNGTRSHVNSRGKIPSIGNIFLGGGSNSRRRIKQDSEPNALPTELTRPSFRFSLGMTPPRWPCGKVTAWRADGSGIVSLCLRSGQSSHLPLCRLDGLVDQASACSPPGERQTRGLGLGYRRKNVSILSRYFFGRIDIFKRYIGKFQIPFFMINVTAKSIKNMST